MYTGPTPLRSAIRAAPERCTASEQLRAHDDRSLTSGPVICYAVSMTHSSQQELDRCPRTDEVPVCLRDEGHVGHCVGPNPFVNPSNEVAAEIGAIHA